ncbi:hypothetical protein [Paracoccus sp. IB05]|uniref:hypothetical protein n=1 Tax=Paracoccus sp. IB05 TaxID=2779367 RepID=UPI0018E7258F|nr:hypothetical protein [Paracoccus sp. IB05]MBJ2153745.1 hypothetical protein [Paracoccus sp. IB05]
MIGDVSSLSYSFIAPLTSAFIFSAVFAGLHLLSGMVISLIEYERKSRLVLHSVRLKYARRTSENQAQEAYEANRKPVLDAQESRLDQELKIIEKEELIREFSEPCEQQRLTFLATSLNNFERIILNLLVENGEKVTINDERQKSGPGIETAQGLTRFEDHRTGAFFKEAIARLSELHIAEAWDRTFTMTPLGYRVYDLTKSLPMPSDLTPETDPPSDP